MGNNFSEKNYFEKIWVKSRENLLKGNVIPVNFVKNKIIPLDYTLATVAIIQHQKINPLIRIADVQRRLISIDSSHYYYPFQDLHITLIGTTQRHKDCQLLRKKIKKIQRLCRRVLTPDYGCIEMNVHGVNLIGSSVFLQVYPGDKKFKTLRSNLLLLLKEHNEAPIEFTDTQYFHMNIMKLTHKDSKKLRKLAEEISNLRNVEIGKLVIDNIEMIIADRIMSTSETIFIKKFNLC